MTKTEFINAQHKEPVDSAAQAILVSQSMTGLKDIKRALNTLGKVLVRNEHKALNLTQITSAVEKAAFLIVE